VKYADHVVTHSIVLNCIMSREFFAGERDRRAILAEWSRRLFGPSYENVIRAARWSAIVICIINIRRVKIRIARDVSAFLSLTMKSYSLQCDAMKLLYTIGGPF